MYGSAKPQVAHHRDTKTIDVAAAARKLASNGVEIEQRLTRMFIGTIAAIDHGHSTRAGKFTDRTGFGVAHHNDIGVAAEDASCIVQRFALGDCRTLKTRGLAHMTTQQVKSAAEADAGSGGWLKKHRAENGALEYRSHSLALRVRPHLVRHSEDTIDVRALKLIDS